MVDINVMTLHLPVICKKCSKEVDAIYDKKEGTVIVTPCENCLDSRGEVIKLKTKKRLKR